MTPLEPPLAPDACYLALKARDARFDGSFFTSVTSTGIYCRPVCRVRTPRRELPLLRPRRAGRKRRLPLPALPSRLAPQALRWSLQDASAVLAQQAARLLDEPKPGATSAVGGVRAAAGHQRPAPAPLRSSSWACRRCNTCKRAGC